MLLGDSKFACLHAAADRGSRPGVLAGLTRVHIEPQTSSWLDGVVELCSYVLWMGGWTGVRPPRDGHLRGVFPQPPMGCLLLHDRTAELLQATRVQASWLQLLTAWRRHLPSAEQLECAVAVLLDGPQEVVRRPLRRQRSVEPRSVSA